MLRVGKYTITGGCVLPLARSLPITLPLVLMMRQPMLRWDDDDEGRPLS